MKESQFESLGLHEGSIQNLYSLGFKFMTPIQEKSLPLILQHHDLIAKAKTGSGKTVAFGLGILNNLNPQKFRIQSLVLCPTRELATQVANTLKNLARYQHNIKILLLTGGLPYKPQVHSLSHQAHIIVGTPGRVLKHLQEKNFETEDINTFVLDEADRMLDMGFSEDIHTIESWLPKKRQTLLFSATYPDEIEKLSQEILQNPLVVEVESTHTTNSIEQLFYFVQNTPKDELVCKLFQKGQKSVIIFCNTKIACDDLADILESKGVESLVLHSDLEQKQRDETLVLFANKSYPVLIATDVASRGLDIKEVDVVINYDLPYDHEVYTHRIGRTARAGKSGKAVSLVEDKNLFEELIEYLGEDFSLIDSMELEKKQEILLPYEFSTLYINGGKKDKLRAGDILGALSGAIGIPKDDVGKIDIFPTCSYVAIKNESYEKALEGLSHNKMKNRYFKIYKR